jgi:flagella basal body P-ring formation protein FlgA
LAQALLRSPVELKEHRLVTIFRRLAPAILLVGSSANAAGFEDINMLEMRLTAALGAGVGEPGGPSRPIDRRLKLAPCPEAASFEPPALGAATIRCEPLGWRVRVPLVRLAAAQAAAEKAEPTIRKGDQVELTASTGSFTVSTMAVAEQDGGPGDRIRVRSEGKKGAVIGVVTEDGRVSLPGFK